MTGGTRGGNGKFIRTADSIKRDSEAAALRARGWSFQRIAAELGYTSKGKAYEGVMRAYAEIPGEDAEQAKQLDLERIDRLIEQAWDVMLRTHVTVSQGRVVGKRIGWERDEATGEILHDGDGAPIPLYEDVLDDGPVIAAVREIRALVERRAKIIGYDAPVRTRTEVITEDAIDAACRELETEIGEREARAADPRAAGEDTPAR